MTVAAEPETNVPPKAPFRGARVLYTLPDGQQRAADVVLPIAYVPPAPPAGAPSDWQPPPDPLACKLKVLLDEDNDLGAGAHPLQGIPAIQDPTTGEKIVSATGFCSRADYDATGKPRTWRWQQ